MIKYVFLAIIICFLGFLYWYNCGCFHDGHDRYNVYIEFTDGTTKMFNKVYEPNANSYVLWVNGIRYQLSSIKTYKSTYAGKQKESCCF